MFAAVQLAVDNFANKIAAEPDKTEVPDYYFVKQGSKLIKVYWKDIYHLESIKNYVKIKPTQHTGNILIRGSLNQMLQSILPAAFKNNFVKINRSEAIVKSSIIKIGKDVIDTTYGQFAITGEFKIDDL